MASSPTSSWQIDGQTVGTVRDFILGGSRITTDSVCSHEIKRCLLLGRKVMTNLLLLLSHSSRVWLCVTPQTAVHQAALSLGFSRQEHWSGLPFPSPIHWSLRKAFLSLLAILWNSAFKWVYVSFSPLLLDSLLFTAICKASSDSHFSFLHFFPPLGMVLIPVSYTVSQTCVHNSSGTLSDLVP